MSNPVSGQLNIRAIAFGAVPMVVALLIGLVLRPPGWGWALLLISALALGAVAVAWGGGLRSRSPLGTTSQSPPIVRPAPPRRPPRRVTLAPTRIPSALNDYHFCLSAEVEWELADDNEVDHGDPGAIALNSIVQRALKVGTEFDPRDHQLAELRLGSDLGVQRPAGENGIRALATNVSVTISKDDEERRSKLENLRKDVELWEHQRNHEKNLRTYLGDDVFTNAGSALIWWIARHLEQLDGAVDRIGNLSRISAVARGGSEGLDETVQQLTLQMDAFNTPTTRVPDDIDACVDLLDVAFPDQDIPRDVAVESLAQLLERWERPDLADGIRRRFGLIRPDGQSPADEPDPAGPAGESGATAAGDGPDESPMVDE